MSPATLGMGWEGSWLWHSAAQRSKRGSVTSQLQSLRSHVAHPSLSFPLKNSSPCLQDGYQDKRSWSMSGMWQVVPFYRRSIGSTCQWCAGAGSRWLMEPVGHRPSWFRTWRHHAGSFQWAKMVVSTPQKSAKATNQIRWVIPPAQGELLLHICLGMVTFSASLPSTTESKDGTDSIGVHVPEFFLWALFSSAGDKTGGEARVGLCLGLQPRTQSTGPCGPGKGGYSCSTRQLPTGRQGTENGDLFSLHSSSHPQRSGKPWLEK